MTREELNEALDELRAQGSSDDEIVAGLYLMFSEGKINVDQFGFLLDALDYEFVEGFLDMDEQAQKTVGLKGNSQVPQKEDSNDKENPQNVPEEKKEESNNEKEDEEKNAMKLFGR